MTGGDVSAAWSLVSEPGVNPALKVMSSAALRFPTGEKGDFLPQRIALQNK